MSTWLFLGGRGLAIYYVFTQIHHISNVNDDNMYFIAWSVFEKYISSHDIASYFLLLFPKQVLALIHIGSLSFESCAIKMNSVISSRQRGAQDKGKVPMKHSHQILLTLGPNLLSSLLTTCLFLEQDGKQNRLSIQSNEGLLFKDGLNVASVFPLNLDLLPGLLMYI